MAATRNRAAEGMEVRALSLEASRAAERAPARRAGSVRPKLVRSCDGDRIDAYNVPYGARRWLTKSSRLQNSLPFPHSRHNSAGKTVYADAAALSYPALWPCRRPAAALPACAAATGDGVLELRTVDATVAGRRQGRCLGPDGQGQARRQRHPAVGDGPRSLVTGWEREDAPASATKARVYTGTDVHFRVTGGKYRLMFEGTGIDFCAVGVGTAQLTGHDDRRRHRRCRVDGGRVDGARSVLACGASFAFASFEPAPTGERRLRVRAR